MVFLVSTYTSNKRVETYLLNVPRTFLFAIVNAFHCVRVVGHSPCKYLIPLYILLNWDRLRLPEKNIEVISLYLFIFSDKCPQNGQVLCSIRVYLGARAPWAGHKSSLGRPFLLS